MIKRILHYAFLAICACLVIFIIGGYAGVVKVEISIDNAEIEPELGHANFVPLSLPHGYSVFFKADDSHDDPTESPLRLFEDGVALGPEHVPHDTIRKLGMGSFSHWGGLVRFSASDNSDPRVNGRKYRIEMPITPRPWVPIVLLALLITGGVPLLWPRVNKTLASGDYRLSAFIAKLRPTRRSGEARTGEIREPEAPDLTAAARETPVRENPPAWRKAVRQLILTAAIISLVEFSAYIAIPLIGLRNPDPSIFLFSPYRGHELNPRFSQIVSPNGFRGKGPSGIKKPTSVYRIFALGGSTLFGTGADAPYPFHESLTSDELPTAYLERMLTRKLADAGFPGKIEVVNAGLPGYETFQHLVYMNEVIANYSPDLTIFLDGHNDYFTSAYDYNPWKEYAYSSAVLLKHINDTDILTGIYLAARALSKYDYFFDAIYRALHERFSNMLRIEAEERRVASSRIIPTEKLSSDYEGYAARTFLRAYTQMKALADFEHYGMAVFTQPEIAVEPIEKMTEADKNIRAITLANTSEVTIRTRLIQAMLPDLFKRIEVEFHPISTIADKAKPGEQLYIDYAHLTPAGSRVVAEQMAKVLWPRLEAWARQLP